MTNFEKWKKSLQYVDIYDLEKCGDCKFCRWCEEEQVIQEELPCYKRRSQSEICLSYLKKRPLEEWQDERTFDDYVNFMRGEGYDDWTIWSPCKKCPVRHKCREDIIYEPGRLEALRSQMFNNLSIAEKNKHCRAFLEQYADREAKE